MKILFDNCVGIVHTSNVQPTTATIRFREAGVNSYYTLRIERTGRDPEVHTSMSLGYIYSLVPQGAKVISPATANLKRK